MYAYIHMTSKNISITEAVYKKLMKIKRENESFSELFLRLLKIQKLKMEKSFGKWNLSTKEEIWTEFISGMEIFPLGYKEAEMAAKIYDNLESQGQRIDDNDILIAGIMLANGIKKIITKNKSHFERIEDLEIIQY